MRYAILAALLLTGCGDPPPPATPHDPTTDASYRENVKNLADMTRRANDFFLHGKADEASPLVQQGEDLSGQVLAVIHPTLEAMQAASDLDDLYARMLLSNRHYTWAQTFFQKNRARWKYWQPQTEDTARRMKIAEDGIAACESGILKPGPTK